MESMAAFTASAPSGRSRFPPHRRNQKRAQQSQVHNGQGAMGRGAPERDGHELEL